MAKIQPPVTKNQELTVTILDLTYAGLGVAKLADHYVVFVDNALPGETIRIKMTKVGRSYGYARNIEIVTPSSQRVTVTDRRYLQTGIAPLQHLTYAGQLDFKTKRVQTALQKKGLALTVLPTLAAPQPTGYRNKAQIPVRSVKNQLETGFYRQRTHELVPIEHYLIQDPAIDTTILQVRDILRAYQIEPYDETTHKGIIRHIMVRRAQATAQQMVVLVTNGTHLPSHREVTQAIAALPEVVSVVQNINSRHNNVIMGTQDRLLAGKAYIEDNVLGNTLRISAQAFYQINHDQMENLYRLAIEQAQLTGNETVIEAYSGIGSIGVSFAKQAKTVHEIEVVPQAIEDAKLNAQQNGLTNMTFTTGRAEEILPAWAAEGRQADVLIVDPPRAGLAPEFIQAALAIQPERIVYISCDPDSLARDLDLLIQAGYQATQVQPVDMFPQTVHVESVVLISRVEGK